MPPVRDKRHRQPDVRRLSHGHQRRGLPHPHGLLPEDVLRNQGLAGVELQRLAHRQAHGAARLHGFPLLVPDSVLRPHGGLRTPAHHPGASQGVHRVRAAAQLMLQPVPVRHTDEAVQEGLRDDLQGHRGESSDARHRPLQTQFQFQQQADAGEY